MNSGLLAFLGIKRAAMPQPKTHFDQISLEAVKRIVEDQLRREKETEAAMPEALQPMAYDAGEQSNLPEAFDLPFLPRILVPGHLSSTQGITFEDIEKSLGGLAIQKKRESTGTVE